MIAQHSSKTNEHYTPKHVVDRARMLLGGFDLDPASCEEANREVRAERIFTLTDDGLEQPWSGRVFLNPPGGIIKLVNGRWVPGKGGGGSSSMAIWWDKISRLWRERRIESGFFVGFTLEILRLAQSGGALPPQAFPRCYPRARLAFGGDSPTHANVLVYLPSQTDANPAASMRAAFADIGLCEGGAAL